MNTLKKIVTILCVVQQALSQTTCTVTAPNYFIANGGECTESIQCSSGFCEATIGTVNCGTCQTTTGCGCLVYETSCAQNSFCLSQDCVKHTCAATTGGGTCTSSNVCMPGATCTNSLCVSPAGYSCNNSTASCQSPSTCVDGLCMFQPNAACTSGAQCSSTYCVGGFCSQNAGSNCQAATQTCPSYLGMTCLNGICLGNSGDVCTAGTQCLSGCCENGGCLSSCPMAGWLIAVIAVGAVLFLAVIGVVIYKVRMNKLSRDGGVVYNSI